MKRINDQWAAAPGKVIRDTFSISIILCLVLVNLTVLFAQSGQDKYIAGNRSDTVTRTPDISMDFPLAVELPGNINTYKAKNGPLVSPAAKTLFFSRSFHPFGIRGIFSYEEICYSSYDSRTDMWTTPVVIGPPVAGTDLNSINFIRVSSDTLLFTIEYRINGSVKEGVYLCNGEDGELSFPRPIGIDFKSDQEGGADLIRRSAGNTILFSGERNDSYGGMDLYVALVHPGDSVEIKNLGRLINSCRDEITPFLASDNKTLYFASAGHGGFGGFDIFVTHRLDDTWQHWSEPENMGPAINTEIDEEYFKFSRDGQFAFFTRQDSGHDSNIFQVSLPSRQQASLNK